MAGNLGITFTSASGFIFVEEFLNRAEGEESYLSSPFLQYIILRL